MAINFYLDQTTKDLVLDENNNIRMTVNNSEFVSQKIENEILFIRGEYFLDRTRGIPYWNIEDNDRDDPTKNILTKNPDLSYINNIFFLTISGVEGVKEIIKLDLDFDSTTRTLTLTYEIKITDGEIILNTVII